MASKEDVNKRARGVINVMEEVRALAPHCGTNTVIAFLTVAMEPGVTVGRVQQAIGLPPTATARAVGVLLRRARGQEGLNLIEQRPDPFDGRVKHLHLTARGERLWSNISKHLEV